MQVKKLHSWDVPPTEAVRIQKKLRNDIIVENRVGEVATVAGADIGLKHGMARAAVVILSYPDLQPLEQCTVTEPVRFPYVPGLLSFREIPVLTSAFEKIETTPDVVVADGQGMAHPRRFGLACHLGLLLDTPTIGCAKSRLCGTYEEPSETAGSMSYVYDKGEIIGAAVRTRTRTRTVFVSIGHLVDLETSIRLVHGCCSKYRLPETTRWAHKVAAGGTIPPADPDWGT